MSGTNTELFRAINSVAGLHPVLDAVLSFGAEGLGLTVAIASVLYISWLNHKDKLTFFQSARKIMLFVLPVLLAYGFAEFLKALLAAPRPFLVLGDVTVLTPHGGYDSFPSGHATVYASLAVSSVYICRALTPWLAGAAIAITFSRVAAGIHWPFDIVVGACLGILVSLLFHMVRRLVLGYQKQRSLKNAPPRV